MHPQWSNKFLNVPSLVNVMHQHTTTTDQNTNHDSCIYWDEPNDENVSSSQRWKWSVGAWNRAELEPFSLKVNITQATKSSSNLVNVWPAHTTQSIVCYGSKECSIQLTHSKHKATWEKGNKIQNSSFQASTCNKIVISTVKERQQQGLFNSVVSWHHDKEVMALSPHRKLVFG